MPWEVTVPDNIVERKHYQTGGDVILAAGQTLKVETSPSGEEYANLTVPVGKTWRFVVMISITEETE